MRMFVGFMKSVSNFKILQRIRTECFNATDDPNSLCDVINRVNLDRLKMASSIDICQGQGMCEETTNSEVQGPPGISPNQTISVDNGGDDAEANLSIENQTVNTTFPVANINPYN